jgi:transposase-like protein
MKSKKKSLREDFSLVDVTCPECDSYNVGYSNQPGVCECEDCGAEFDYENEEYENETHSETGGMKASLDRHVKESRMRTRRR